MPKLSQTTTVTTKTEVTISTKLQTQLKEKLTKLKGLVFEAKVIKAKIEGGKVPNDDGDWEEVPGLKAELETLFADADEYTALETGAKVEMFGGEVGLKLVKGNTAPKFNPQKALTRLYVKKGGKFVLCTLKDLDKCMDPSKPKKPYLGVFFPGDRGTSDE